MIGARDPGSRRAAGSDQSTALQRIHEGPMSLAAKAILFRISRCPSQFSTGLVVTVGTMMVMSPGAVMAEAWIFQPEIRLSQSYDDNFRLSVENPDQVWTTTLSTIVGLTRATETTQVVGRVRLDFVKYVGDTDRLDDKGSQYLFLDVNRRWERFSARAAASYVRSDTLVNQFRDPGAPDFGLGPVDPDAGLTTRQTRRKNLRFAPGLSYSLSERNSLEADFRYQETRYDDADRFGLTNFRTWDARVGVARRLSEISRVELKFGRFDYKADDRDRRYDTDFATVEYSTGISETLNGQLTLGWRNTDFDTGLRSGSNNGAVYLLSGAYTTERSRFTGRVGRTLTPSGGGSVAQRDELTLQWNYDLRPKWGFVLKGRYFKDRTVETLDSKRLDNDREWLYVTPTLEWRFARDWSLNGSYTYRRRKNRSDPEAADGNAVMLSLVWVQPASVDSLFNDWF